jgi:hypothetical protein
MAALDLLAGEVVGCLDTNLTRSLGLLACGQAQGLQVWALTWEAPYVGLLSGEVGVADIYTLCQCCSACDLS